MCTQGLEVRTSRVEGILDRDIDFAAGGEPLGHLYAESQRKDRSTNAFALSETQSPCATTSLSKSQASILRSESWPSRRSRPGRNDKRKSRGAPPCKIPPNRINAF